MSALKPSHQFDSAQSVIDHLHHSVSLCGTPGLAGIEEEIIVLDQKGSALSHVAFQSFLADLITALPNGQIISGTSVHGQLIPVLMGTFGHGSVQPETNTTLVEFAHAPTSDVWGSFEQSRQFSSVLRKVSHAHGLQVVGSGVVPSMQWDDFLKDDVVIPNNDFRYSWTHMMERTRPEYCRTVFGTASVHHNMGFNDPDLMARYMSTSLRLQPTMIGMVGNSPLWANNYASRDGVSLLSHRSRVQIDYGKVFGRGDGVSYLYPDFLVNPGATFESIISGYLDLPLDRTVVEGNKIRCAGLTMRSYLQGYKHQGQIYFPDEEALTMMIREPIVDVRPSFTGVAPRVETRAHDCVSQPMSVAIDAFYRGILANLDEAQALVSGMSDNEVRLSRRIVCEKGLQAPVTHTNQAICTQKDMAVRLVDIADEGLQARGLGEAALLSPLRVIAESGRNPAQRLLSMVDNPWDNDTILRVMDYMQQGFADGVTFQWPVSAPRQPRRPEPERRACNL